VEATGRPGGNHRPIQSFGYEAEEAYTRLLEEGKADGHSYFSTYKMKLFQEEDSKEIVYQRVYSNSQPQL
jgi:hypothetical protein